MRIAVCDDEKEFLDEVVGYLNDIQKDVEHKMDIQPFQNAEDLLYEIEEMAPYDIVILDIELGANNGISVAENIKKRYPTTLIIFMTGFYQYVYEVFDVQPVGFLRKPIQIEEFKRVFLQAVQQCDNMPALEYNNKGHFYRIFLKDIWFITSEKRQIILMLKDGEERYYGKMDEVEQALLKLTNNFWRISQSVIINTRYLKEINYHTVTLENGDDKWTFNISQTYRVHIREKCMDLWKLS